MIELQEVFARFSGSFIDANVVPHEGLKAVKAILSCQTAALGGHVEVCDGCHTSKVSYNSSRVA